MQNLLKRLNRYYDVNDPEEGVLLYLQFDDDLVHQ